MISPIPQTQDCNRPSARSEAQLLKSVQFEDLGARVDSPGVRNDPLPVLSLQERSSDLARPDDEVPQATTVAEDTARNVVSSFTQASTITFVSVDW